MNKGLENSLKLDWSGCNQGELWRMDIVIASSHSSDGGSHTPAFVGDVDERTAEITANGTDNMVESENIDDDSFVVVNALEASVDDKADDKEATSVNHEGGTDDDDDLDLDALLDDSIDGHDDSSVGQSGDKDGGSHQENEIETDCHEEKPPAISEDTEDDPDLDALLIENFDGNDESDRNGKETHRNDKYEACSKPDSSDVNKDKEEVELDDISADDGADDSPDENYDNPISRNSCSQKEALAWDSLWGDGDVDDSPRNNHNEKADTKKEITSIEDETAGGEDETAINLDSSNANEDTDALELDALLGDESVDGSPHGVKNEPDVTSRECEEKADSKDEAANNLDPPDADKDKDALELDALLDDSDHEVNNDVDLKKSEEKAPSLATPKIKKQGTSLTPGGSKSVSKTSSVNRSFLPSLTTRNDRNVINTPRKIFAGPPKRTPAKKAMENISSSVSDTFINSKNKAITARDGMREYSREISSRASNQLRKKTQPKTPAKERNLVSSSASKLSKPTWAENWSKNEFRNYMKSTVAFKNKVVESHRNRQRNMELKEDEARKIVVNLTPWKTRDHVSTTNLGSGRKPRSSPSPRSKIYDAGSSLTSGTVSSVTRVANSLLARRQRAEEAEREMQRRLPTLSPSDGDTRTVTPFSFIMSPQKSVYKTPRKEECIVFTEEASARFRYQTPGSKSYCGQSVGSLSSQCTVESFLSPRKEGIAGCQNKYEPMLHQALGPCELCVFRLSDVEKQRLDAQGRHLMVQFTRGGCQDCSAFPKAPSEPPVRLCPKCYAQSHRRVKSRRRKRGNGSHIGYSFATVSEDTLR